MPLQSLAYHIPYNLSTTMKTNDCEPFIQAKIPYVKNVNLFGGFIKNDYICIVIGRGGTLKYSLRHTPLKIVNKP
jgi:hypothetical protein